MTDRLHFDDLTKITAPFGMLDDDTQERLKAHGGPYQAFDSGATWQAWENPGWWPTSIYRAAPAPLRPASPPWHVIAPEWKSWAMDRNGSGYFFKDTPIIPHSGSFQWVGVDCVNDRPFAFDRGNMPWRESLVTRPEGV